jgi:3-hydroxyisobutyrate dehydrogenase-like beta-hydroxyacid dehydrogenase
VHDVQVFVIGRGYMGSRIVDRLQDHGHEVVDDAAAADVVFTVVPDDDAVRVAAIDSGLLASLRDGAIYADLSTTSPGLVEELATHAREAGVDFLDVEMSGSTPQVESGELALLVGGDEHVLERIRPVLEPLATSIVHMGPVGAGSKMKLVVNTLLGDGMQALAEAIGLGEAIGLDRGKLLDGLSELAVVAPAHKPKLENVKKDEYPVAFALRLMQKDFGLVLDEAANAGVAMPATQASAAACADALDHADEDVDFSFVARHYHAGRSRA